MHSSTANWRRVHPDSDTAKKRRERFQRVDDPPVLPSANCTLVGFSLARNALNIVFRAVRNLYAMNTPRPRPRREPMVACVESFAAALRSALRSDSCRSCCMCSSASLASSSRPDLRKAARDSVDMVLCGLSGGRVILNGFTIGGRRLER